MRGPGPRRPATGSSKCGPLLLALHYRSPVNHRVTGKPEVIENAFSVSCLSFRAFGPRAHENRPELIYVAARSSEIESAMDTSRPFVCLIRSMRVERIIERRRIGLSWGSGDSS